jgi:hypothetical protein
MTTWRLRQGEAYGVTGSQEFVVLDSLVDLFIGARAPAGFESNFMKAVGEDGWFVYFRLYAPLQPFFDKTFSLGDFEMIQ